MPDLASEDPQNIEWELGRSRTSPHDLLPSSKKSREQINDLIQRIINDQDQEDPQRAIAYYDEEVKAFRLDKEREHELKKVLFDAAELTVMP